MAAATQIELQCAPARSRFDPEFELLVACCGCSDRPNLSPGVTRDLDWERVLHSAEHHRLIPVMHSALAGKGQVPSTLRVRAHKHAWRVLHFTVLLTKIAQRFDEQGIQFIAYKGPALAQVLYHNPAMRQFGDLDLIVRPRDVSRAKAALIQLGYEPALQLSPRQEKSFLRSGYEYVFGLPAEPNLVELQWHIVPRFRSINFDMDALFSRSMQIDFDGVSLHSFGREDLLLVLCVHAAKHEWAQLGMLRDIATLAQSDLDWKCIAAEASRLGILKLLQISLLAVREVFCSDLSASQLGPSISGAPELASAVVARLQNNYQPVTKSFGYFRSQVQMRERLRDRAQFIWRLATTPGVEEWNAIRIPDPYFALYRGVRLARLLKHLR